MNLESKPFEEKHYNDYVLWFSDPELNRWLGPVDDVWLEATLSEVDATWAVLYGGALVGVIETSFDETQTIAAVTGVAVKPELRRRGVARAALLWAMNLHYERGVHSHLAYVAADNFAAQHCLKSVGFTATKAQPNEQGYVAFRHYRHSS